MCAGCVSEIVSIKTYFKAFGKFILTVNNGLTKCSAVLPVFTWRHKNSNYKTIDPSDILLQWCIRAAEN